MCNGINDFWKWCNTTIPTIFDNSMSYYEFLCKMAGALKSLADEVKSDEKDIDANKKAIEMLREQLNNLDIAPEVEAALQKMLEEYRATILNIDMLVMQRLESCFMQIF